MWVRWKVSALVVDARMRCLMKRLRYEEDDGKEIL